MQNDEIQYIEIDERLRIMYDVISIEVIVDDALYIEIDDVYV